MCGRIGQEIDGGIMAKGDLELKIKVDPHIHRCVQQLACKVYEDTGVMIESIEINWGKVIRFGCVPSEVPITIQNVSVRTKSQGE